MASKLKSNINKQVSELTLIYTRIRDVVENRIKEKGEIYLPNPGAEQDEEANEKRYSQYIARAVFYNFLARTLIGFVGQIYSRDPEIKVPSQLDALVKDANGDGLTLEQLSKEACAEIMSMGRFGLLVDYPEYKTAPSKADVDAGIARPVIIGYRTENIITWDFKQRGAKRVLSYLELVECYTTRDKETNVITEKEQLRILSLSDSDVYTVTVRREDEDDKVSTPTANGNTLNEIPFYFIGAVNNDARVDRPPFQDMADINIGHYRNSADYEESVFLTGQPTLVVTGLSEKWYINVLKKVIKFGSRNGIHLEKDSDAKLIQAEPNVLAKEAMDAKKEQLAAMGAEFLREQSVQKTATEADINDSARTSAISTAAKNVSDAFQFALEWAAIFQGQAETSVTFKLNTQFDLTRMTEQERAQLMKEWQEGAISWTEYRSALHKAGIATEDDAKVQKENEEKAAADLEKMAAEFEITNPPVDANTNVGTGE